MRKLLTWLVITFGIAALVRRLKRKRVASEPEVVEAGDDPAGELRRKLDESRAGATQAAVASEPTVEERRADVHEQGRAAIDEMQQSTDA